MTEAIVTTQDLQGHVVQVGDLGNAELARWEELCLAGHQTRSPFLSPTYARAIAAVHPYVYVCVLAHRGEPVGFFPFQFQSRAHRMLGAAGRIGGEMTDYCGLVADARVRLDGEALIRFAGLRHFLFTHLDESQTFYGLWAQRKEVGLLIDLADGRYWEELRKRNRRFFSDTNRLRKKLQADYGPLRFSACTEDWRGPLDMLIRAKRAQYSASGVPDPLAEEWTRRLLRELAGNRSHSCRGVLSTLYAGDTWVSSQFSLEGRGIQHDWFPVYNRDLSPYAPGRLLLWEVIAHAPERGILLIDRGAGDSHAKRQLANASHNFQRGAWVRPGVRSLLFHASCAIKWRLNRRRYQFETNRA